MDSLMAVATLPAELRTSPTWRQFQLACGWVALALGVGCALYAVETLLLGSRHRFVENPADTMTRAVGLAHFSLGWLFLFTSPRLRHRTALARLTFWTLFGIGFCAMFAWGGADKNPLMLLAFYSFFFIHEVCDEAHLFRHSGELPCPPAETERFLRWLCTSTALGLMTFLAGFHLVRGHVLGRSPIMHELPTFGLCAGWLCLALAAALTLAHTLRQACMLYGSVGAMIALYRPLLAVYAGISTIFLAGSFFGSVGANLVILVHGMTWLVYTQRRLSEQNAAVTGPWSWLRHSPAGFLTLHLSVTCAVLVLFALRTHVWQRTGLVCDLLSRTNFPYWSIMHIAMAFWRAK
jgi:hypothetical protein